MEERGPLEEAIAALEAQRPVLGDGVVDTALAPLREKLAALDERGIEQRKLVTVLFSDLAGFTAMSESMDPEDVREVVNAYFSRWTAAIEGRGGTVEKFIGDAVMAVFGLAAAREDDAERAVRSALDMVASLDELNAGPDLQRRGLTLTMRVGITTGEVVLSTLAERTATDFVVVGDTVNLASRLQALAPENGILLSADTERQVHGLFELEPTEPLRVKGKAEPVQGYVVRRARPRAFRMPTRGIDGVTTALVGRQAELAVLESTVAESAATRSLRTAAVVADAGVGKSRLLTELEASLDGTGSVVVRGRASPGDPPYALLRDAVASHAGVMEDDPPDVVAAKVESLFAAMPGEGFATAPAGRAAFVAALAGLGPEDSVHLRGVTGDAAQLRERALLYLAAFLRELATVDPVVVLLEDLHWADQPSLDAVAQLMTMVDGAPVAVLGTARPDLDRTRPGWLEAWPQHVRIDLPALSSEDTRAVLAGVLGLDDVPAALLDVLDRHAEGNPFYAEELVKVLVEDGALVADGSGWRVDHDRLATVRVPPTLTGVLQARLDAVPVADRLVAQRGSVIGRRFWDEAVAFVAARLGDTADPGPALERLGARDLVAQLARSSLAGARECAFTHALLHEVAYESVLKRDRRLLHGHAGDWLASTAEARGRADEHAEAIGHHLEQAGRTTEAARWYGRAGTRAAARYANAEALALLARALHLTPDDELDARFDLLVSCEQLHDLAGDREAQAEDLALLGALADRLDDDARRARLLTLRARHQEAVGRYDDAIESNRQAVVLARSAGALDVEATACSHWGDVLRLRGDTDAARQPLESALAAATAVGDQRLSAYALRSLGAVAEVEGAYAEATGFLERALAMFRELDDKRGDAMVANSLGIVEYDQGHHAAARQWFERSLELKRGLGDTRGEARSLHNLALVAHALGDLPSARQHLDAALEESRRTFDAEGVSTALLALGAVAMFAGDLDAAGAALDEALTEFRSLADRQGEAEARSYRALLHHRRGDVDRALSEATAAVGLATELALQREESFARTVLGHTLLAAGDVERARAAYRDALALRRQLGDGDDVPVDALAGAARAAVAAGDLPSALDHVRAVVAAAGEDDGFDGSEEPVRAWETCADVLAAAGDEDGAASARARGQRLADRLGL